MKASAWSVFWSPILTYAVISSRAFWFCNLSFAQQVGAVLCQKSKIEFLLIYDSDDDDHVMFHTEHNWRGGTLGY
jgi:hypothetical protein